MNWSELLPFLFFLIASVYSTVGFAGGSSYLLILTLAGFTHMQSVPIALLCNLVVSGVGFFNFYKAGHFRFRLVLPFTVMSIPMAFVGARAPLGKELFFLLLGLCLVFVGLRLFFLKTPVENKRVMDAKKLWFLGLPAGGLMGFFSGLIGIGGGIFLSPLLILTGIATLSEASAAASFFIFLNSMSGLMGKIQNGLSVDLRLCLLVPAAMFGGIMGSKLGSGRLMRNGFERVLAALVLFVSASLLLRVF